MFIRKEDKFYIHLRNISTNLMESTNYFVSHKFENAKDIKDFAIKMKEYEHAGDNLVHKVIHDLNKVFITPIEREDILSLTKNMDDVLDGMESTAALLEVYSINRFDDYMAEFLNYIDMSVKEINESIELISKKKLLDMREHIIRIKDYESKCDELRRKSIKYLFDHEPNPIEIIKYKEIYEELERVSDYCEAVANTLEAVIMKNA